MKRIRALIVDDESKLREVLKIKIEKFCSEVKVIGEAANINEAYDIIVNQNPDCVFLDIAMPGGSGFELLNKFEKINFHIIFVTGYNEYALDALRLSAIDYLLKPIKTELLVDAVNKLSAKHSEKNLIQEYAILKQNLSNSITQKSKIKIPSENYSDFVELKDIIHIEGWQKYSKIYLSDDRKIISSYNLGHFKELLSNKGFYSSHKSHIVNINHVLKYNKAGFVILSNGSEIPISRRKKEEFLAILDTI